MRRLPVLLSILLLPAALVAQDSTSMKRPPADSADVASPEAIVAATYDVISGPAGPRNWDRFLSLFGQGARLIPTGCKADKSSCGAQVLTPEEYVKAAGDYFKQNGFFERGTHNVMERYGLIAQVFSTYESRHAADDPQPFVRGINSFQLRSDGTRWYVMSIMWVDERTSGPIPAEYGGGPSR